MATICPTITAENTHDYRAQAALIEPFARRWHIDIADGQLAPRQLIAPSQLWWPKHVQADIHVMYKRPLTLVQELVRLQPHLVIVHAEGQGNFAELANILHAANIKVGIAVLATTPVDTIAPALELVDHVLVFSGNLGYQGGSKANLNLLRKVTRLRELKPQLEIGWDGGINDTNASALKHGGVDVLNVGGFIHYAVNPQAAYATLEAVT